MEDLQTVLRHSFTSRLRMAKLVLGSKSLSEAGA